MIRANGFARIALRIARATKPAVDGSPLGHRSWDTWKEKSGAYHSVRSATRSRGFLGDDDRDDNPLFGTFWTHVLSGLRWLKMA